MVRNADATLSLIASEALPVAVIERLNVRTGTSHVWEFEAFDSDSPSSGANIVSGTHDMLEDAPAENVVVFSGHLTHSSLAVADL